MKKKEFAKEATEYLGNIYKTKNDELKGLPNGVWWGNNKEYSHILPSIFSELNLLKNYRDDIKELIKKQKIKLHPGFSHLNSSQAMCLNFFYPFIMTKALDQILDSIGIKRDHSIFNEQSCLFEKKSTIDADKQSTSFDFYIPFINGENVYFEIKYTESEFGRKENNDYNQDRFKSKYLKAAEIVFPLKSIDWFMSNYQIVRNAIHILGEDNINRLNRVMKDNSVEIKDQLNFVVLLFPEHNAKLNFQAMKAQESIADQYKQYFKVVTWEKL
jgi:hypothetical protein